MMQIAMEKLISTFKSYEELKSQIAFFLIAYKKNQLIEP